MVVRLGNSQSTGTDKSSTARNTTAGRYIAIQQNLHTSRSNRLIRVLLAQELHSPPNTGFEVIRPVVMFGVDLNLRVTGDRELTTGELVRVYIGDLDDRAMIRLIGGDSLDGDQNVDADSGGKHIVEIVVDVLSDDVDATWTTRDEIGAMAIVFGKLGDQGVPSRLVLGGYGGSRGVGRVDVDDGVSLGNEFLRGCHSYCGVIRSVVRSPSTEE